MIAKPHLEMVEHFAEKRSLSAIAKGFEDINHLRDFAQYWFAIVDGRQQPNDLH
jgi:hypothetical protein